MLASGDEPSFEIRQINHSALFSKNCFIGVVCYWRHPLYDATAPQKVRAQIGLFLN
jgi:hypothetical protein